MKQSTFNLFISKTISNKYLHSVFIIFEYFCFIFPACIEATMKLTRQGKTIDEYNSIANTFKIFLLFKYIHYNENIIIPYTIIGITLVFLIIYSLLFYLGASKNKALTWCEYIIINVFNLFIFRYFSIAIFYSFIMLFVHYISAEQIGLEFLSIIFIILFILFFWLNYFFINHYYVLMTISNPQLVKSPQQYPYDKKTKEYETVLLILKMFIVIECVYWEKAKDISLLIIGLNAMILLLSCTMCILIYLINTYLYWSYTLTSSNETCNTIRKGISMFNCFIMFLGLFFLYNQPSLSLILITCIIAFNLTIIILFIESYYFEEYHIHQEELSYEMILLMLINNLKDKTNTTKYQLMQETCRIKHKANCKKKSSCVFCEHYSTDLVENTHVFFLYKKKEHIEMTFAQEIVILFYYRIHSKIFKFYQHYYFLIQKYNKINTIYSMNLQMIIETWLIKDNNDDNPLREFILEIDTIGKDIKQLLKNAYKFILQDVQTKNPQTAIELSSHLSDITRQIKVIVTKNIKLSTTSGNLDNNLKHIISTLNYNTVILRYIIECIINQPLRTLMRLNVDSLEDSFNNHYSSDHILICSTDFSLIYNQEIRVIKATQNLIDEDSNKTSLSDYFPLEIRQELIEHFRNIININQTTQAESFTFTFPFLKKNMIEYIKYSFFLSKIPQTSSLMMYGQYEQLKQKILLLDFNHPDINIVGYCKDFLSLMNFKKKWLDYLKEVNITFYLTKIFTVVDSDDDGKNIQCEFDYDSYLSNFKTIRKQLRGLVLNEQIEKEMNSKQSNNKIVNTSGLKIKIFLTKVAEYVSGLGLYTMIIENTEQQSKKSLKKKNNNEEDISCDNNDNNLYNLESTINSASSGTSFSAISSNLSSINKDSEYQILNVDLEEKIAKGVKQLSCVTIIMLGINISLILVSGIFLFTQITQTQQLSDLSILYYQFKGIRWALVNFFLSIATTICYSNTENPTTSCINPYETYSTMFQKKYEMPEKYSFLQFARTELEYKANFAQTTLNNFKRLLYTSKNTDFQELLDSKMKYYEFEENSGRNKLIELNITFEDGLRKYINTFLILIRTSQKDSYEFIPIYFIRYEDRHFIFNDLTMHSLSLIQKELYKGLMNYVNFFYSFSIGDTEIKEHFYSKSNTNNTMNIIFMISIFVLNLIIGILCKQNINSSYILFKILIYNVVAQTEKKDYALKLKGKLDNLILLAKFYRKNPMTIIKKIERAKTKTIHIQSKQQQITNEELKTKENYDIKRLSFGHNFYCYLLGKFIIFMCIIFGLLFLIIILFDIVLLLQFYSVLNLFDFVLLNYNTDHTTMTNMAMTTVSIIGNISHADLAIEMGINNTVDGILNKMVRDNILSYNNLADLTLRNKSKYPKMESMVKYNCDELYSSINESFIVTVSNKLGEDYNIANVYLCKAFNILSLPNFNYLRSDIGTRTQGLINKRKQRDYKTIYLYTQDQTVLETYTILLSLFRPLSKHFKETVLLPKIKSSFSSYVQLVGVYLAVNILLEITLFLSIKWGISNKLFKIQKNLYLLNNCVN